MKTLAYTVRFISPAFLGNAEQNAQWRTPPLKALLRQWWRVAYAADHGFRVNVAEMRREEGMLFGNAWLEDNFRKSLVRIRLDRWEAGKLKSWSGLEQQPVYHPEVQRTNYKVGPHAYLGYGPLDGRGNTQLDSKRNAAIQAGESATLALAVPEEHAPRIGRAIWLIDRYGALGGRSRNGWGSISLTPLDGTPALTGELPLRPWRKALDLDWPHAIGQDDTGALVWQTRALADWKALMRELAIIKIGLRTQFIFTTGPNAPHPENRHWLSYPVTRHNVAAWRERGRGDLRLPNSLRFKVRLDSNDPKNLVGVIFHVPCLPPREFQPNPAAIVATWKSVHALLGELTLPGTERNYAMITDTARRSALAPDLNSVALARTSP